MAMRGQPRRDRLTDDDDEDPCHYLEGQREGDECQHCYVVPGQGRRAPRYPLFMKFVNRKCKAAAAVRTGIRLPAR